MAGERNERFRRSPRPFSRHTETDTIAANWFDFVSRTLVLTTASVMSSRRDLAHKTIKGHKCSWAFFLIWWDDGIRAVSVSSNFCAVPNSGYRFLHKILLMKITPLSDPFFVSMPTVQLHRIPHSRSELPCHMYRELNNLSITSSIITGR